MHIVCRVLEEVQIVCRLDGEDEGLWCFVQAGDVVGIEVGERAEEGLVFALSNGQVRWLDREWQERKKGWRTVSRFASHRLCSRSSNHRLFHLPFLLSHSTKPANLGEEVGMA